MLNPYNVPDLGAVRNQIHQQKELARAALQGPAIGMISVATLGLLVGLLSLGIDVLLLTSGAIEQFENPDFKRVQICVRVVLGMIALANCGFSIWAGIQMQQLRQHQLCWLAAVLACIPVIGPCVCLGIPTGAWALTVLNRQEVADAFD